MSIVWEPRPKSKEPARLLAFTAALREVEQQEEDEQLPNQNARDQQRKSAKILPMRY